MTEALLGLVAVLVAAAVTVHWQQSKHQADSLREDHRSVVDCAATLFTAVGQCKGFVLTEVRQGGMLWEFQRHDFHKATELVDTGLVKLQGAIGVLKANTPFRESGTDKVWEASSACVELLGQIDGWAPHPTAPTQKGAQVTIVKGAVASADASRELAAALHGGLQKLSHALDGLSSSVSDRMASVLRSVRWIAYGAYVLLVLFLAGSIVMAGVRGRVHTWTPHVQAERIIWTDATSRSHVVVALGEQMLPQ